MRLDHSIRFQINERNLAMFTVWQFAKSSLLVVLTVTLTTAAYARGGGHSSSNGSNGSNGSKGASQPVYSSTAIVSKQGGKTLPNGSVALLGRNPQPYNNPPIVRDHRGEPGEVGNTVGGVCNSICVGQGGLNGAQPSQNQDHSTGGGNAHVTDHRTGH
jgi:hypothetical protein